ncbi:hypothetical protein IAD21_01964 [Abditibacteriota bacterium]|nr:hypothetical protein IAD21_01964 [Abditibacteriota bacterium]
MGFLDKLFGNNEPQRAPTGNTGAFGYGQQQDYNSQGQGYNRPQNADEQAVARYRYMLQTAPPEDIERAHEEAFARLTPEQRQLLLQQLSQNVPQSEAQNLQNDPRSLARAATRAEVRQPGFIERTFGGGQQMQGQGYGQSMGGGMMGGMGGMIAGSLLSSMAGSFIGSSIAHSFFSNNSNEQGFLSSPEAAAVDGGVSDFNPIDFQQGGGGLDASADPYGDPGGDFQNAGFDTSGNDGGDFAQGGGGLDASADPYGDPADAGGFDGGDFDAGGFDSGGFDGGDFGGDF